MKLFSGDKSYNLLTRFGFPALMVVLHEVFVPEGKHGTWFESIVVYFLFLIATNIAARSAAWGNLPWARPTCDLCEKTLVCPDCDAVRQRCPECAVHLRCPSCGKEAL